LIVLATIEFQALRATLDETSVDERTARRQ